MWALTLLIINNDLKRSFIFGRSRTHAVHQICVGYAITLLRFNSFHCWESRFASIGAPEHGQNPFRYITKNTICRELWNSLPHIETVSAANLCRRTEKRITLQLKQSQLWCCNTINGHKFNQWIWLKRKWVNNKLKNLLFRTAFSESIFKICC